MEKGFSFISLGNEMELLLKSCQNVHNSLNDIRKNLNIKNYDERASNLID